MARRRYPELSLTAEDRETLLGNGVDVEGMGLEPLEGARGFHIATWIDDDVELEFMVAPTAPVDKIVETLYQSVAAAASDVGCGSVVVAAARVEIAGGQLAFGEEMVRREWHGET